MEWANYDLKLNEGWKFHLGQVKRFPRLDHAACYNACKAGGALGDSEIFQRENAWEPVSVPHDWLTALPCDPAEMPSCGYKKRQQGWYYIGFRLDDREIHSARLVFDGVSGQSTVYVNGTVAVRNFSAYNRFSCEIGDYLLPASENIIAVYVDASVWEGWWYEGAGIYRPVRIAFRGPDAIEAEESFVHCRKEGDLWYVDGDIRVARDGQTILKAALLDMEGVEWARDEFEVCSGGAKFRLPVQDPRLWSPESPCLYTLKCELLRGEECLDHTQFPVGFRSVEWIPDHGMYLNGKPYRVKGTCCHQDHAGVGAAVPTELLEYRISLIKEMGANAYRCAHHAPSEELLDICDRQGLLVMVENRHFSVSSDALEQVEALVKMARNHPCVFLYSLFNEEPWQAEVRGMRMADKLCRHIRSMDPTRAITAAMNGGVLSEQNASDAVDVVGINYCLADYENGHIRKPEKVILGTENSPTFATRGVYRTDAEKQVYAAYGEEYPVFSESLEETMEVVERYPFVAGCFVWSAFDYHGEPNPKEWPSVFSHWGMMDACGFKKDIFYLLAAWYKDELMVHLLPHWNWREGETVRVCAFTNADTAELYLNGRSLGVRKVEKRRAWWQVDFEAGQLTVVARRGGKEIREEVRTAGAPAAIQLENVSFGDEISIWNACVTDEKGTLVPDFDGKVQFEVTDGKLLGIGNGDPNGHNPEQACETTFFHGCAQVIVRGTEAGIAVRCPELSGTRCG